MSFGKYFQKLMEKSNMSVMKLADMINCKSKTEIYRLFDEKHSYEKTKVLTDKILNVMEITNAEKDRLYSLMEKCRVKISMRRAWDTLECIYKDTKVCYNGIIKRLDDIVYAHKNAQMEVYIGTDADINTVLWFAEFLRDNADSNMSIIHTMNFNKKEDSIAKQLFTVITLAKYSSYSGFETTKTDLEGIIGFINDNDEYCMFIINDKNGYVETPVSQELYDYLRGKYGGAKKKTVIKRVEDKFTNYADILTAFTVDGDKNVFDFEGMFCFSEIPFDIMYKALEDSNFFGFPKDSPYITQLVEAARKRFDTERVSDVKKRYIMTEEQVKNFVMSGKTVDYVEGLRALTEDEVREVSQCFMNNPKYKYRFLDFEHCKNCIEVCAVEDDYVLIWSADFGYGKGSFRIKIDNPKVLNVYISFAQYFWKNHTMSDEYSRNRFSELVEKYLSMRAQTDDDNV